MIEQKKLIIENSPKPVSIEGTQKILDQMKNCVCKIILKKGIRGTGFFCKISIKNNYIIPVMITNNHLIDLDYIKNNTIIKITLNNDKEDKTLKINDNRLIYTNEEYDITIIEIKPIDDSILNFMELDEKIFNEESEIYYEKSSVYNIHYPEDDKVLVSYGIINDINNKYDISHLCKIEKGASGSPILNLSNNKLIGIHKGTSIIDNLNHGTFLKYPINDFISKNNIKEVSSKKDNTNYFKDSKIIKNNEDINFILSALKEKINFSSMKIIYQATIHGDTGRDFKLHCNNKGPTLVIIKSKNNEIFGGFTKCNWTNKNFDYGYDKDAFLYSITNKKYFNVIIPEKAIINYDEGYAFACFGNQNNWDGIYIFDSFLSEPQCYCNPKNLTNIYNLTKKTDLCSDDLVKLEEMEVYQII